MFHSQDGHGFGTVTEDHGNGVVKVKWDNGNGPHGYFLGYNGEYELTLAESISEEEKRRAEEEKEKAVSNDAGQSRFKFICSIINPA